MAEYRVSVDASGRTYVVPRLRIARALARALAQDYGETASNAYVYDEIGTLVAWYRRSCEGRGRRWYWAELGVR